MGLLIRAPHCDGIYMLISMIPMDQENNNNSGILSIEIPILV
jgi:hypothetical protein